MKYKKQATLKVSKKYKRRTELKKLRIVLLLLLCMCLAGCGKNDNGNGGGNPTQTPQDGQTTPVAVRLNVWAPQEDQTALGEYKEGLLKAMCAKFQEAHPEWNITFTYGVCSEGDARNEISKDPEAAADVFMFSGDQTAELVENGVLAPVTVNLNEIVENNSSVAIEAATFNNLLYGIPFSPNTWFMYYDKSLYSEEEVKSLDTMLSKDLGKGAYNIAIALDDGWYNASFFFANGCNLFGENGNDPTMMDFNNEKGVEVGKYLIKLVNSGKFLMDTGEKIGISYMSQGKCGALFSGTWDANAIQQALGENYAATVLPTITINGEEKQLESFGDFKYVGVNLNTNYPEAAQALAAYLGGPECQKIRLDMRSIVPTWKSVLEDEQVSQNVAVVAASRQLEHVHIQSTIPQMSNFWEPAKAFAKGIYGGSITEANLQASLDAFVKNVLGGIKQQ